MKIFSMKEYIRMMKSFDRENISVFLGAGASVQSQIPSAKDRYIVMKTICQSNILRIFNL